MFTSHQCNKIKYRRFRNGHPGLFNKSDGSANTKNPTHSLLLFLSKSIYCFKVIIFGFPSSVGTTPKYPLWSIFRL